MKNYLRILKNEIANYFVKFKHQKTNFIELWPQHADIRGWFVRLLKGGYQESHIHPEGWLSGVVYLKTIEKPSCNGGAIELGLHGYEYPIIKNNFPTMVFKPRKGDIILFPSSLFHATIPFNANQQRITLAFDIIPTVN